MEAIRGKFTKVAVAALAVAAGFARAGGVDPKYVPADAKWVVHVDVDEIAKSKLWGMMLIDVDAFSDHKHVFVGVGSEAERSAEAARKLQSLGDVVGMK